MSRGLMRGFIVMGVILIAILACNDHGLNPIEKSILSERIEEKEQEPFTLIDILWIIDDSGSMCEEQDNLTRNFEHFIDSMVSLNARFRLAVVTTDVKDPEKQGRFQNNPARTASQVCEIQPNTSDCPMELPVVIDSDNYLIKPDDISGGLRVDELRRDFRCIATVGTEGDGFEKGLMAARLAMDDELLTTHNVGFLREEAYLVIVFLSDENDCSDNYTLPRQNGNECEWRREELVAVQEYVDFFKSIKSDPAKIVVAAIIAPDDEIHYDAPNPVQPSCAIEGQGEGFNGYRYKELVEMFGENGVYENICQAEFNEALDAIKEKVVAMVTEWCLSSPPPDCESDADCYGDQNYCESRDGRQICSNWRVVLEVREKDEEQFVDLTEDVDYEVDYASGCSGSGLSVRFIGGSEPSPESEIRVSYQRRIAID